MFQGIKSVFRNAARRPFGVLVAGLSVITLMTASAGVWHHKYELAHQSVPSRPAAAKKPSGRTLGESGAALAETTAGQTSTKTKPGSSAANPTKSSDQTAEPAAPTAALAPPQQQAPATANVFLSVNGTSKGVVAVSTGSNHCDILTQALTNGQISSLDMRYSSQYGTQAVYMIDGIGDGSAVWWTYQVNGSSPPYGCSQLRVKSGDSVQWKYVKQ